MLERTRNLIEPAGAAPLAAALKLDLAGQKVGLIASGGNMTPAQLRELLNAG
jgi:threonine dehydratase